MNTVTVNYDTLSTDQLDRLADDLFTAVNSRRQAATQRDGIISDAELIARRMGQALLDESAKSPNKRDGYLYLDEVGLIRVDAYGNAQTIIYEGREVWNKHGNVFLPREDWMAWVRTTAQALRDQHEREREADLRQKLVTSLQDTLRGTEFPSVAAALEHFQLGPFAPAPATPALLTDDPDTTESSPSPADLRRQILLAGLQATSDPELRSATLRLIRRQFGLHMHDTVLCQAVVARIEDEAEFNEVRREAVATAWCVYRFHRRPAAIAPIGASSR
ncbi:MAG: hypothetical protein HY862_07070 [Chloroflexi bacterium]|nr:hypothetical protein [Chloroflexota bacterium]